MKVFLSYASKDRALAERVCRVLEAEGHNVFFDRDDLGGGDAFGERIRAAIRHARVLVYLISQASVTPPSYALTELSVATALEPRSRPAILPVRIDATPIDAMPAALRAFTILEPQGDVPAEVASAVERLTRRERHRRIGLISAAAVGALALITAGYVASRDRDTTPAAAAAPVAIPLAAGDDRPSDAQPDTVPAPPPPVTPVRRTSERDPVEGFNDAVLKRTPPDHLVTLIGLPGNDGWSATLVLVDQSVTKLNYRVDGAAQFTDAGTSDIPNPLTGQPRPNTDIQLTGAFWKPRRIDVKYTDAKGRDHGPFRLDFDPRAQFLSFTKQALRTVAWVTFTKPSPDRTLAYFTTVLSFKPALREIRYSVDSDTLDSVWPLKADPDDGWPARLDHDTVSIDLPASAHRVVVKLTFVDGSMQTRSFEAPRQ
jgi:hypothetical protein